MDALHQADDMFHLTPFGLIFQNVVVGLGIIVHSSSSYPSIGRQHLHVVLNFADYMLLKVVDKL